jgi:hypothetical protein
MKHFYELYFKPEEHNSQNQSKFRSYKKRITVQSLWQISTQVSYNWYLKIGQNFTV